MSFAAFVRRKSSVLSMMIAQHQIEEPIRPSMTTFTTRWALQKSPQREKSCAAGRAAIVSAGFIEAKSSSRAGRKGVRWSIGFSWSALSID